MKTIGYVVAASIDENKPWFLGGRMLFIDRDEAKRVAKEYGVNCFEQIVPDNWDHNTEKIEYKKI